MRALLQSAYGEADTLTMGDVPVPTPGKGQVLVRVAAASVNAADVFLMRGVPRAVRPGIGLRRPVRRRLGVDLAGVVADVGSGVTRWRVGDAVFGQGIATFAEFALADGHRLAELPDGVRPEHAAALPIAGTTAMCAVDVAKVERGQRVVVTGVAGGVGQFAAQLAALRGADVIGVCSGRNVERVRALGIEHVLDYETQDPLDTAAPYDAVIDNAGGVRIRDWRRVVARGGAILPNSGVHGPDGGALMRVVKAQWHGLVAPQRVRVLFPTVTTERLTELGQLLATDRIRLLVDTVFTLDRAPEALAAVGTHHARGKVIVTQRVR
ncbi:MAG: NAD(P)-dependent alcohol dehydrogenase [Rhodococcus sp. (in: high G+C Gram-positive bacteria)]|uniref:NAD(P)-dependent alcohol dehydrogenase n=1 Tax=Rhodococcus sp. TaxID=1831 RepID=UPI003BB7EE95